MKHNSVQHQSLAIFNLQLHVDAFLSVRQRELVEVIVPQWVQELGEKDATGNPLLKAEKWKLLKCLPGQRKAALRWSEHFKDVEKARFQCRTV